MAAEVPEKKRSKFTFPTAYTILALLLVVVAISADRCEGNEAGISVCLILPM